MLIKENLRWGTGKFKLWRRDVWREERLIPEEELVRKGQGQECNRNLTY